MKEYRIITIPGDGIGPELMESTIAVLEAVQEMNGALKLNLEEHEAGAGRYAKFGKRISDETLQACREADGVLKAPVGDPAIRTPQGTEAGLLGGILRTGLDLFANMRPVKLYPGISSPLSGYEPGGIDYVVIRENTEGLYASRDKGVGGPDAVADTMIITR
ncbi:MAG: isocitrate/isopropylmalate family dehydrogenase, partial [Nitrospinae bacterium]|nr:isocitrate/isopropylmalate family dehydrogenase [Nitrospinota bacterium]